MEWFAFSLIATVGWGLADLFYKKGTDENDRYSHLKISFWVGLVMGAVSVVTLFADKSQTSARELLSNVLKYSPASLGYILSMVIGYAGLRYLEVSIISPVQNASGAFSAFAIIVFYLLTGRISRISEELSPVDIIATVIIVLGVCGLAFVENRMFSGKEVDKKHRLGALALIFPLLYCLFDSLGTAADGIILNGETSVKMSETEVLTVYGLTFFLFGICSYLFLLIKEKRFYNPFAKKEISEKGVAAVFEEFGQIFYIYAMAAKPVLAAPMIASYCVVSVLLSRIFLNEKLNKAQYICVFTVIIGIIILGISEGISEI